MRRLRVAPRIHVRFHDMARVINIVAIDTGPMTFVLSSNLKAANRSAVSFTTTRDARRCGPVSAAIEIGFLRSQAHDDRRPPGMTLREVRCDDVSHCAAPAENHEGGAQQT